MRSARFRFACLWVSLVARGLADWSLLLLAFLAEARQMRQEVMSTSWRCLIVFSAPFFLPAPLNGSLSNGLPRRRVLVGSAGLSLLAVGLCALLSGPWLLCLGVAAVGSALFRAALFAMLPAAGAETEVPLPRLTAWVELGTVAATVGGLSLGWLVAASDWPAERMHSTASTVLLLLGLNSLCLLAASPVRFPSDVFRREPPWAAAYGFFRDSARILKTRQARGFLMGLAGFLALVLTALSVLAAAAVSKATDQERFLQALALIGLGAVLGCVLAGLQGSQRRSPGFVPLGATGLFITLFWIAWHFDSGSGIPLVPGLLLGFFAALVMVPLRAAYLALVPADARGNGAALMNGLLGLITVLPLFLFAGDAATRLPTPTAQLLIVAGLAGLGCLLAWLWLFPQAIELVTELAIIPAYRVRAHGPGKQRLPVQGPLIVIANHSAYLDPFWLSQLFPGHLRPLMTSAFYDLPGIRWLMVHVVEAIRVPTGDIRRRVGVGEQQPEAFQVGLAQRLPELREAVAALRQGACLLIFPEGALRRGEDQLLRLFGQGVWHILRELPDVPVMPVWIEGGWGSWASYAKGPPLKNKPLDWRRRIDVVFGEPGPLPADVLAHHRSTRAYLMRACLECRRYLGLEVPGTAEAEEKENQTGNNLPT